MLWNFPSQKNPQTKAGSNKKYDIAKTPGLLWFPKKNSNLNPFLKHFLSLSQGLQKKAYLNTTSQKFWHRCAKFLPGSQIINDSSSHKLHLDRFGSLRTNYCIAEILASHYKLEKHDPYKGPSLYYVGIFWDFFWTTLSWVINSGSVCYCFSLNLRSAAQFVF